MIDWFGQKTPKIVKKIVSQGIVFQLIVNKYSGSPIVWRRRCSLYIVFKSIRHKKIMCVKNVMQEYAKLIAELNAQTVVINRSAVDI